MAQVEHAGLSTSRRSRAATPGVEALRGHGQRAQSDVVRQEPPQAPLEVDRIDLLEVDVRRLTAGVDARIGAAGTRELRGLGESQDHGDRGFHLALRGAQARAWMAHPRKPVPS